MDRNAWRFAILPCGWLERDKALDLNMYGSATAGNRTPPATWWRVPVFAVLLSHARWGLVLLDGGAASGCGFGQGARPAEAEQLMPYYPGEHGDIRAALHSCGVEPGDLSQVVLSNLHFYTAGILEHLDGCKAAGQVYLPRADFAQGLVQAHKGDGVLDLCYLASSFEQPGIHFHCMGEEEDGLELLPGLELLLLEGAYPATLGLRVQTAAGTYLFPGAALPSRENLGPPATPPGMAYDSAAFVRTVKRLAGLMGSDTVIFARDPGQYDALRKAPYWYGEEATQ